MQPGQGKVKGAAFGWDPKDRVNGLNLESSQQTHSAHDTNSLAHTGLTTTYVELIKRMLVYVYNVIHGVFFPSFDDKQHERQFTSQEWYLGKMLALYASVFLIANWILACIPDPVPDLPRHINMVLDILAIIEHHPLRILHSASLGIHLWRVRFFFPKLRSGRANSRKGKTFLGRSCLFALGQRRFPAALIAAVTIILMGVCIVPYRQPWARLVANAILFHAFIIYVHWAREMSDRDRFVMSRQIKEAYLYRHRLQMREKQIQNSKQRLTGYIFHEVRVPLNTAMLAVQNIEASGAVSKPLELEFNALSGSLTVMSKVLNDVLDLNRMDAGKFESVNKPYAFHKVIESLLVPLRLAVSAKGLQLIENLDPRIDDFVLDCLIAAKKVKGQYDESEELEPLVVGDEMRFRQIFTNFTSNATKFSPPGGRIEVVTKLLWPAPPGTGSVSPVGPGDPGWFADPYSGHVSSTTATSHRDHPTSPNGHADDRVTPKQEYVRPSPSMKEEQQGIFHGKGSSPNIVDEKPAVAVPVEQIVIRIEVRDTGSGIKKRDIKDAKLFSPYVQTEIGRHQGGKGTGLGLALVRRIVKLSGGRLGVKSKFGQGSCFWVELPLKVGSHALIQSETGSRDVSIRSRSGPTRAKDFALDQSSMYTNPTANDGTRRSSFTYGPPAPHFSHRTIMEQQGLVEMTPSRPELRHRLETPLGMALKESTGAKLESSQSYLSDTQALPPHNADTPPRQDSSMSAPAAMERGATVTASASNPSPDTKPPLSILVVDDDALTRKLMTRLLARLGCTVTTAENGLKALELLLGSMFTPSEAATPSTLLPNTPGTTSTGTDQVVSQPRFFDVVFLDNQMPQMSGLDAIARLRAAGREDLVVGVTGNALIRDQDEYLAAGVDHVLIKPVLEKSLKQMLSLAERRRTAGALEDAPE
ncbi:hypothetical protein FRC17_010171 [Serendipita sp. 399]|nr:hypothetical protein FRC17_010171 [Serendipita sp. 399]